MSDSTHNNNWERYSLDDITQQYMDFRGRTPLKLGMQWGGGDIRALSANNVQMGRVDFSKEAYFGSEELYRRWMTKGDVEKGDVLLTTEAPLGNVAQIPDEKKYILSQRTILLKLNRSKACLDFVFHLFQAAPFQAKLLRLSTGTTVVGIQQAKLARIEFEMPPLSQQRKIARILTTLDSLIEKTEAMIAKYQAIKQGMMHDLFTRGVDQHGHLRPNYAEALDLYKQSELGWIPKEWTSPTVGQVLVQRPKNGYSPKESDEWTGTVMLGLGCLTPSGFEPIQLKHAPKHDPNVASALLKDGDLLISRSNTRELVALVGIYRDIGIPCIYSDLMMRLVLTNDVLPEYLEAVLRHAPVRRQLTNASCGTSGSMMKINAEMVVNTVIALPIKDEQERILDRVVLISRFIMQIRQEREKYRVQKTGLMQDLLTGKVRVKVDESEEVAAHA